MVVLVIEMLLQLIVLLPRPGAIAALPLRQERRRSERERERERERENPEERKTNLAVEPRGILANVLGLQVILQLLPGHVLSIAVAPLAGKLGERGKHLSQQFFSFFFSFFGLAT